MINFLASLSVIGSMAAPAAAVDETVVVEEVSPSSDLAAQSSPFYVYRPGMAPEKTDFKTNSFLTLNLDLLKGNLPKLYGGVTAPASVRIEKLSKYLSQYEPDMFLAQEVPLESAEFVSEALKGQFSHMWMGMGISPGKEESGLFVASKYPILSKPQYVPFPTEMQRVYTYPAEVQKLYPERILDRGFFAIETPDAWIVTTHLEAGSPEIGGPFRKQQLAFLTEQMKKIADGKPFFLAGDLNIERTAEAGDEYSQSGIQDQYFDLYTEEHPAFDDSTYTCTNMLTFRANNQAVPPEKEEQNEIDDYVLLDTAHKGYFQLSVELLSDTYDLNDPNNDSALTDHRAYQVVFSTLDSNS